MSSLTNYLKVTLFGIAIIFYIAFSMNFWFIFFPIAIIVNIILIFKTIQEKYVYDFKFWIDSLNILDAALIIAYIISLSMYLYSKGLYEIYNLINIISFVIYIFNHSLKEKDLMKKSKYALPYVNFNDKPKNILNRINNILQYDLDSDDILMLKELLENDITIYNFDDDEKKNSAYRLTHHKFALKSVKNNEMPYTISIDEQLIPYLNQMNINQD